MAKNKSSFAAPRGMRDFYPPDMLLRNTIFDAWTKASRRFAFEQYDACVVESLDLLKRKSGEEIIEQIYAFSDKGGRQLALRPEMTPTLARMVSSRRGSLTFPLKWFAIAQCFRYERMTRGRKREHYQWNLDIIGEKELSAEVEILAAASAAMIELGLGPRHFRIFYSSRRLLTELLLELGIPEESHTAAFLALDKRGKIDDCKISELLTEQGIGTQVAARIFEILSIKSLDDAQSLLGCNQSSIERLRRFEELCSGYGIDELVSFDISVIRGLAYYTGIVFEAFDTARKGRAIFGGGRYDNLLADVGGSPMTAVGLGFGDVVIADMLQSLDDVPRPKPLFDIAVGFMQAEQRLPAMSLARVLREKNLTVDCSLHPEKPRKFFSRVGKGNFSKAVFIGPDDLKDDTLRFKNLRDRTEERHSFSEYI